MQARLVPALVAALLFLPSCARLPDYATPKGRVVDAASLDASDLIPFRTLERGDFRGSGPPAEFAAYAERMGAVTCGRIVPDPGTRHRIERDGQGGYFATPEGLSFRAMMDRRCSWWNPEQRVFPAEYVLEHEQIHFAIVELEARRLNARVPQLLRDARSHGDTPEQAAHLAEQKVTRALEQALATMLDQSRRFDEDTSLGHRPERQREWGRRVREELERTQGGGP